MVTHPPFKRHRAVLSCMRCHDRKKKCNRTQPCNNCLRQGTECVYINASKYVECSQPKVLDDPNRGLSSGLEAQTCTTKQATTRYSERRYTGLGVTWPSNFTIRPIVEPKLIIPCPANNISYLLESCKLSSLSEETILVILTTPLTKYAKVPVLLSLRSQYCSTRPRPIEPISLYSELLQFDSVKFATIYLGARLYAAQLGSTHGELPQSACLHYKQAAIQTIRQALENSTIVSEEDILAVILMTMSFNKHLDNYDEREAHMNGIKKMIAIRGGWDGGRYGGLSKDLFNWCEEYGKASSLCASFCPDI